MAVLVVLLLGVVGLSLGQKVALDQLMDQLVDGLNSELVHSGQDTLVVSGMAKDWDYSMQQEKVSGHCNCTEGYVKSLATVHRTGDVAMTKDVLANSITLKTTLGLGTLEFGFYRCQFTAAGLFSVTQPLAATFSSNSIQAEVRVVKSGGQCSVSVDRLDMDGQGEIQVRTGASVLQQIEGKLVSWLLGKFRQEVAGSINRSLRVTAGGTVDKADLCKKLPF